MKKAVFNAGFLLVSLLVFSSIVIRVDAVENSWNLMDSGTTRDLYDVWGSSGNDVYAVGDSGTILHYTDGAWSLMDSGTTTHLLGVWGSSGNDVYAVGNGGTILHYTDGSWSPMISGTTSLLRSVWGSSSNDVFAVGIGGTILHYTDETWNLMDSETTTDLLSVWGSSGNDVFAVGISGIILHYTDGIWSSMGSSTLANLYDVWGSSNNDVFTVGQSGTILHYTDGTWSPMDSGTTTLLLGIWGSSSNDVFAAGYSGKILHYNDGIWSLMDSGIITNLREVWGNSGNDVFTVGNSGTILHYTETIPYVRVTYPDGGEVINPGEGVTITWESDLIGYVKIGLYRNGAYFGKIIDSTPNDGSYDWTVHPDYPPDDSYQVVITSVHEPSISGLSGYFTLTAGTYVTVTYPDGGEVINPSDLVTITWESDIVGHVKIGLYRNDAYYDKITSGTVNDGQYDWTVPPDYPPDNTYQVVIISVLDPSINDISNGYFVINRPPQANIGDYYESDEGSTIVFDASNSYDPDGDELQYRWDVGNDGTWETGSSVDPTFSYSWPDDASLEIAVEVTDGYYSDTDTANWIVLNVAPSVNAGLDQTVCEHETVEFEGSFFDPGRDLISVMWDFDDGTIQDWDLTPTHEYNEPGTYQVELRVEDGDGGLGIDYLVVTVKPHIEDVFVYERLPNNNFKYDHLLYAGIEPLGYEYQTLIKFCLLDIPSDAEISYASLELYCTQAHQSGVINAYRVLDDWSEVTANWNNKPDHWMQYTDYVWIEKKPYPDPTWYYWDVTDDVILFHQNPTLNYGWMLTSFPGCYGDFVSSDSTSQPRLSLLFKVPTHITLSTEKNIVDKTGDKTIKISGYLTSSYRYDDIPIELYYSKASSSTDIPTNGFTQITEVRTTDTGYYEYDWDPPDYLGRGYYCIKVVKGDFTYHYGCYETTGGSNDPNILVTTPWEPDSSIVSWWQGEDNPYDIINGNHGYEPNEVTYSTGIVGQAFNFDGIDDELLAPDYKIHEIQELTIEGWVYLNSLPNRIQRFVTLSPGLERAVLRHDGRFNEYGGQLHFYMKIGDENSPFTHLRVNNVLYAETWHHVAATYDGSYMRLYLDGSEVNSRYVSGSVVIGGDSTVRLSAAAEPLDGKLDEISIYNKALDAEEIRDIYENQHIGKKQPYPIFGDTITSSITLERDLINCPLNGFIVGENGITIDGDGHKIIGTGTGSGISLVNREDVTIKNIFIEDFNSGIYIDGSAHGNNINTNVLSDNTEGITLRETWENVIERNRIITNGVGISGDEHTRNNQIYRNMFVKNIKQIRMGAENIWKDPIRNLGNFWSDYIGKDTDIPPDFIGDEYLPWANVDWFPVIDTDKLGELMAGDWVPYSGWITWRATMPSTCEVQVATPFGNTLSKDYPCIGLDGFYIESEHEDTKFIQIIMGLHTIFPMEGTYTCSINAQEDLEYSMEWFASQDQTTLFYESVENMPLMAGESQEIPISVESTVDPDTGDIIYHTSMPEICSITAPLEPVQLNTQVEASMVLTDPDITSITKLIWDWGDNSVPDVIDQYIPGTIVSHTYNEPGVYTFELTIITGEGKIYTSVYRYVVVYDPEGGFVTGGGWINSPEGAYSPDPSLAGKATFGFVSKYKKGVTTPTGNTEFVFHAGDLEFHSSSYEWMVIAGTKAKYKGAGTINGEGEYDFMLTATDSDSVDDPDLFRIKIWDRVSGGVIYDNKHGESDDGYSGTELGGGNIKVHKG